MEREARKTAQAKNEKLGAEVEKLQDLSGSYSRQLATQQIFVKSLKNRILESQTSQQKKFEEILKLCAQFEGKGAKEGSKMLLSTKEKSPSSPGRKKTTKVTVKKDKGSPAREKKAAKVSTKKDESPVPKKATKAPPQREKRSSPTGKELTDKFSELQSKHSDESS